MTNKRVSWVMVTWIALVATVSSIVVANSAVGFKTPANPSNPIEARGCVVRFDTLSANKKTVVPRIHANSAHECVGVTRITVEGGVLVVYNDGGSNDVVTLGVSSDETLTARGIFCGGSGGGVRTRILCYKNGKRVPANSLEMYGAGSNLWLMWMMWDGSAT